MSFRSVRTSLCLQKQEIYTRTARYLASTQEAANTEEFEPQSSCTSDMLCDTFQLQSSCGLRVPIKVVYGLAIDPKLHCASRRNSCNAHNTTPEKGCDAFLTVSQ
eukprot:3397123-Amphidinium_carterae.3